MVVEVTKFVTGWGLGEGGVGVVLLFSSRVSVFLDVSSHFASSTDYRITQGFVKKFYHAV